jgi:hypothetical protein
MLASLRAVGTWAQQRRVSEDEALRHGRALVTAAPGSPCRTAQATHSPPTPRAAQERESGR